MALLTPTRLDDDDIVGNNRIIYQLTYTITFTKLNYPDRYQQS